MRAERLHPGVVAFFFLLSFRSNVFTTQRRVYVVRMVVVESSDLGSGSDSRSNETEKGLEEICRLLGPVGYDGQKLRADADSFDPLPLVVAVLEATSAGSGA